MISAAEGARPVRRVVPALILACAGCAAGPAPPARLSGPTMGTTWSVTLVPGAGGLGAAERQAIDRDLRDTLTRIEALMSTWDRDSELSRFNRWRSTEPFPVSPDTYEVFRWALTLLDETGGAFDVTVLPLVEAWGFGASGNPDAPAPDEEVLARLRAATGPGQLALDPGGRSVRKRRPEVECDFSGLAPGYAADALAARLAARGLTSFLVDVGGELVASGQNAQGVAWKVAVERPDELRRGAARVVPISGAAIATSGDYRSYRNVDGTRITHIIDPRSGAPVRHRLASATVIDRHAVRADGLATALMVLGPDEGLALAERLDLAAFFIVRADDRFEERVTTRFEAMTRTE